MIHRLLNKIIYLIIWYKAIKPTGWTHSESGPTMSNGVSNVAKSKNIMIFGKNDPFTSLHEHFLQIVLICAKQMKRSGVQRTFFIRRAETFYQHDQTTQDYTTRQCG